MTGKECITTCQNAVDHIKVMETIPMLDYTVAVYAVITENTEDAPWTTITTNTSEPPEPEGNNYLEMLDEGKVRELLSEIFLWLSGMGEYPEILAQICPEEIVGKYDDDNEEERSKVAEKSIVQVLRWVLGEI